ncbi:MAG: type IV pilus twitching motility protein PilT [Pyrinomonadaceae bacterium]
MEMLNEYLRTLLSSCGEELRLEPGRNPYIMSENQTSDVAQNPLAGSQISSLVFPLIPPAAKASLPNSPEVEFVHPHPLGNFNFTVAKSPAGFIVTIRPLLGNSDSSGRMPSIDILDMPVTSSIPRAATASPQTPDALVYEFESSSLGYESNASGGTEIETLSDLLQEEPAMAMECVATSSDAAEIEIIPFNDPQYETVFSDTSDYEPPGRRDDFAPVEYAEPAAQIEMIQNIKPIDLPPVAYAQPMTAYAPPPDAAFVSTASHAEMSAQMDTLFHKMAELGASDLHLSVGVGPMMRKDGKMMLLAPGLETLTSQSMADMLTSIMPPRNKVEFASKHDTDFAYEIPGLARFRGNIFMDRKGMGAVFRIIPTQILTAAQLGLSKAIMDLCSLSKGLVVVTGPTGSGKSTTLCAMVDSINRNREDHIITIEDPIEFVHENEKCLINQREVHTHTDSFKDALRAAFREDPDIVLVGEMRDLETVSIAIETAETGHLVFGTLHTTTAASTVDRIIDQFPADRQQQIRVMLSESLKGVVAQTLLPKKGGGRVAALEILIVTPAISNLIREGKTFQIPSAMQTGKNLGMVMLNDALFEHVKNGLVEPRDAYIKAVDKAGFETMLTRGGFKL